VRRAELLIPGVEVPRMYKGWVRLTDALKAAQLNSNAQPLLFPCGLGFTWYTRYSILREVTLWPRLVAACVEAKLFERTTPYILRSQCVELDGQGPRLLLTMEGE
jgi:hypothetical protein